MNNDNLIHNFLEKKPRKPTACYPESIINYVGDLYGYWHQETNFYNIVSLGLPKETDIGIYPNYIGKAFGVVQKKPELPERREVHCYILNNVLCFDSFTGSCAKEPYQLKIDIFSRNTGILESDIMLNKGVIIIGCGSVGSLVALELARAGVGRFFLIDGDIMSYHNICRHQCGIQDVGKFKTTAVKERILQINPTANIKVANKMIQEIALSEFDDFCNGDTIIIGCADNRDGDLYADSMIGKVYNLPFISIGFWERAFAGEIFYCLPEGMPSYSDFVKSLGDSSGRTNANTHLYMGEVGTFEPGISVDINFVTTIGIKMILDLLNKNNPNYTQRLIYSLTQYTLVCNTNNPKIGGEMAEIFSYPLQVTRSIEVNYSDTEK